MHWLLNINTTLAILRMTPIEFLTHARCTTAGISGNLALYLKANGQTLVIPHCDGVCKSWSCRGMDSLEQTGTVTKWVWQGCFSRWHWFVLCHITTGTQLLKDREGLRAFRASAGWSKEDLWNQTHGYHHQHEQLGLHAEGHRQAP